MVSTGDDPGSREPEDRQSGGSRRGRPPLSEARRREQRLAMSRAAVRLFREHGVDATSGEQIAREAGVSVRTFWRTFRAKEASVEPLLTQTTEAFQAVLRTWPPGVGLAEHLDGAYALDAVTSRADLEAVLAVVRLSRHEPALRAAWLVLGERIEPTIAEVLADHLNAPADDRAVRVRAAAISAALRVATDDLAWTALDGAAPTDGPIDLDRHRTLLAATLDALDARPDQTPETTVPPTP
jgi:AcrR family transcriptional regulator